MEFRFEKLREIENEVNKLEEKINYFKEQKQSALIKLVVHKWMISYFNKSYSKFDKLKAKRLRTSIGMCSEELMKLLFQLDQVQSEGNEEIKKQRRLIVKRINTEILPLSDEYLIQAQSVLTLYNRTLRFIDQIEQSRTDSNEEENISKTLNEEDSSQEKITEEKSMSDKLPEEDSSYQANTENVSQKSLKDADEGKIYSPRYKVTEGENFGIVDLILPLTENSESLKFEINQYENEILVIGKEIELPLRVSRNQYDIEETRVKIESKHQIKIYIPKRKISQYQTQRNRFYSPLQQLHQPRHYAQNYYF